MYPKRNFHLKRLHSIIKKKENSSTIETKLNKYGNKVSMYETVKEVDEETITKENITLLKKDHTNSLQYDNVEDIGDINNSLMI